MFLALHAYLFGSISHLAIALGVKAREGPDPTALTTEHLTRYAITKQNIRRKNYGSGEFFLWLGATRVCCNILSLNNIPVTNNFLVNGQVCGIGRLDYRLQ